MLAEIFHKFGSDKESFHHYASIYEWLLFDLKHKPIRLLEIGVQSGGSLRAWEEYLVNAEIVGVDIDPACASLRLDRARVVIGDASKPETFSGLGDFDVIIDDGGHQPADQLATLATMWERTRSLYVIEDISWKLANPQFQLVDTTFHRLRRESAMWRSSIIAPCWTIFAKELIAFKKLPQRGNHEQG